MLSSTEIGVAIKEGELLVSIDAGQAHPIYMYARVDSGA